MTPLSETPQNMISSSTLDHVTTENPSARHPTFAILSLFHDRFRV